MWYLNIFLTVLGITSTLQAEDGDYEMYGPTYFEKLVYKAKVVDRNVEIIDGPITLKNCPMDRYNVIAIADEHKYYTIPDSDLTCRCHYNCSVCFSALVRENVDPEEVLYDTITLEAHVAFQDVVTTTIIIVFTSEYDPYKLVYSINGTEFVILNYFYFKIFLLVIIVTGILLLVLEIREIILKFRAKEYALVPEINFI